MDNRDAKVYWDWESRTTTARDERVCVFLYDSRQRNLNENSIQYLYLQNKFIIENNKHTHLYFGIVIILALFCDWE